MSGPEDASQGGNRGPDGAEGSRPSETELSARLERLNTSLGQVRAKAGTPAADKARDTSSPSGVALAFRLGAEFVSGVLVGSLIGYGIDRLFSITPFGLIVFTLVGFAAGVLNMLRASGEGGRRGKTGS
ncbi:AtpZ/AtpI family protein [Xanthobacter dioxanivorans]|uniref:AtpZ/AtpI family protein n=1 Tax=Xanthobacter dioxanivorans TaxID=2528964 RepID=A0A974PQ52_9HYPH|nr:AtpZ/AtpI family protein [Xanthobacter dioxanivorans]QRG07682.1 AtpZ/AtpI family protein [Xanthobacter dioxanivorans]